MTSSPRPTNQNQPSASRRARSPDRYQSPAKAAPYRSSSFEVRAHQRRPRRAQRQLSLGVRLGDRASAHPSSSRTSSPIASRASSAASMPGTGRPIEPGRISALGVVGDHDRAGLGLPPRVVDRTPERLVPPHDDLGVERLADAADVPEARLRSWDAARSAPAFISMRSAVGAVYQTVTRCSSRMRYQRSASNSCSSTTHVTPQASGAMTPYDVPVTQPGSAVHQ